MSVTGDLISPETGGQVRDGEAQQSFVARLLLQRQFTLTVMAIALFGFFSVFAANFFTLDNVYDMARVSTYLLIVGVPMTYLFIAGELDLSVGSNFGIAEVLMALLIVKLGVDPWLAACGAILLGLFVGVINGFATTVVGVPSFIITLGMLSLLRGLALVATAAIPVVYPDTVHSSFFSAANGRLAQLAGLPVQVLWGVVIFAIGAWVLRSTRFGHHVYATGGNARAARASGISTRGVKFMCFALTGAGCGLIGALEGGWLRSGFPTTGTGFELQVIAAVIIGGVALTGGEGSVYGTFLGVAIIGMLYNGLTLIGVQGNWNQFFIGLLIVVVGTGEVGLKRRHEIRGWIRRTIQWGPRGDLYGTRAQQKAVGRADSAVPHESSSSELPALGEEQGSGGGAGEISK
jgi:ribose transport system permease protein